MAQTAVQVSGGKPSELRIVLLGGRNAGKSCVGNMILCAEEFVTRERTTCLRRHAEIFGERVVVTDTPGWWCDFQTCDTPAIVKREIVRSVALSHPGPNIFLLVIKLDSAFTKKRRRAVQEHLELLGEAVWHHTSVVFTKGEQSNGTEVEDLFKRGGKSLQWVLDKCGNRSHAVDISSTNRHDIQKTASLLGTIKEMMGASGGIYFQIEQHILQENENSRNGISLRAQIRLGRANPKKHIFNDLTKATDRLNLVLLGAHGSGKSLVGNTILSGQEEFDRTKRTACCVKKACRVARRQVTLVDTPGWWMNYFVQDSPAFMKLEMVRSVHLCPAPGPHALVLVVRLDKAFTETYARALYEHVELLGVDAWKHAIVVFSFGDWLGDTTIEYYIESEGRALQWLVKQCGNRYHVFNNKSKGDGFQVAVMLEKIEDMLVGNGDHHYKTDERVFMELERRRRAEEERAGDRMRKVSTQRKVLKSLVEVIRVPPDLIITLLGGRHCGKSSTGNTIFNREEFEVCGRDTDLVEIRGMVNDRDVTVIKVPERNSVNLKKYDLTKKLSIHSSGHGVILLVINCSSSFRRVEFQATVARLCTFGRVLWHRTMVLFTNGDWLGDTTIEQHIESEGELLRKLIENCGNRYHVLNNKNQANRCQVSELMEKIEEMVVLLRLEEQKHKDAVDAAVMGLLSGSDSEPLEGNGSGVPKEDISTPLEACPVVRGGGFYPVPPSDSDVSDLMPATQMADRPPAPEQQCMPTQWGDSTVMSRVGHTPVVTQTRDGWRWVSANAGRRILVLNAPEWLCSAGSTAWGETNGWAPASSSHSGSGWLVFMTLLSQRQPHMLLAGERAICREQSVDCIASTSSLTKHYDSRDPNESLMSGGLQQLIDEWGDSNIEELEAFIDSYIDMFLKDSLESAATEQNGPGSFSSKSEKQMCVVESCHEVLSSIDRKLSKLGMLEKMQRDLEELKRASEQNRASTTAMDPKQTTDCFMAEQSERQSREKTS